ncbi:MAG: PSD1 and planctomycete cytochrome C domain-containing protein [Bryobacteraceae bacterium]
MIRAAILIFSASLLAAEGEFFELKVRPVLAKNCFGCHAASKMGGLELTSRESMLKGGKRGPALMPGDPAQSLVVKAIHQSDPTLKMPPSGKLADSEIADLESWIKSGATWPATPAAPHPTGAKYAITPEQRSWWAFQPVRKPRPPQVKDAAWGKQPIDAFVLARLEQKGLKPNPAANPRDLIRRAYYDLIGLPPTAEQIDAFVKDKSPGAFAKVIEDLLASPRYGERWGRYWLDVARYSDDRLNSTQDDPYPNAFRYRDWVIQAFNEDLPYDIFLKAQIAGDQLVHPKKDWLVAGLGFYALSPEFQDDRVDATTRGLLAMTAQCAQCHDHKFDPIPTKDYYAMLGVFTSTRLGEFPLAPTTVVKEFKDRKAAIEQKETEIADFLDKQATQLAEILAGDAARYLASARNKNCEAGLDRETCDRFTAYLATQREHPFLNGWDKPGFSDAEFQKKVLDVWEEKKKIEETNFIRLGGSQKRGDLASADLLSLERDKYFLWRDLFSKDKVGKADSGVFYYRDGKIDRFLEGVWKSHLTNLRAELDKRKKALPEQYPFYHIVEDVESPKNQRIRIRGSMETLGDEAPRAFLSVFSEKDPQPFTKGSGRLELAEAIASSTNPLTPRVMVNRVWQYHFGRALVGTPANFGQLGEKPSHPELLDYLAARLLDSGWSIKAVHREIMLSNTYRLSSASSVANFASDPDNKLFWRANRRRLEIEPLRDTLLAITGELDLEGGGLAQKLTDPKNRKRTIYGFVSRRRLDGTLSLFDFPNPNNTSEQRIETATPLQALFFLNSEFLTDRSKALAAKLEKLAPDDAGRIKQAYRMLYGRAPVEKELRLGLDYLKGGEGAWTKYAHALLSANELLFIN